MRKYVILSNIFQMVKTKAKLHLTRGEAAKKMGGGPSDLRRTEPCTYRELIQYFYYLQQQNKDLSFDELTKMVAETVVSVWGNINPKLPLIKPLSIKNKVRRVLETTRDINSKKKSGLKRKSNLMLKLDKLFDLSACECDLPNKLPCDDRLGKPQKKLYVNGRAIKALYPPP